MKISRKSWHYQLVLLRKGSDWGISNSLCKYFWQVVISALLAFFVVSLAILFLFVLLTPVAVLFTSLTVEGLTGPWAAFYEIGTRVWAGLSVIGVVFGSILGIKKLAEMYADYKHGRYGEKRHTYKKPNLLVSWVSAKKKKVCPIIDFTP